MIYIRLFKQKVGASFRITSSMSWGNSNQEQYWDSLVKLNTDCDDIKYFTNAEFPDVDHCPMVI